MVSANASFILFLEIGRIPRRDRSYSASRSVQFRVEIGPVPRRDRSASASKSVALRREVVVCQDIRVKVRASGVVVFGVAHGRSGFRRGEGWFLLE